MIRIRYPDSRSAVRDLAGWHGRAERDARGVTVYLLPGLTGRQRQAVLRRLRQQASRGLGPALPLPGLLIALGLDRLRAAVTTVVAVGRLHPVLALLPGAAVGAMTLFLLASGSGVLGPARPAGLDGLLASSTQPASGAGAAARGAGPGAALGPEVGRGGSELGSGAPAPVWQARPHDRHRHPARLHPTGRHQAGPRHRRGRGRDPRSCAGSRGPAASPRATQRACRGAAS